MVLSEEKQRKYMKRLLLSRMRLLNRHPFYGLLLMHMRYGLSGEDTTAYTDGRRICFAPEFLESLNERELDFVLMHEILHVVLRHCTRGGDRDPERFNTACDIVVNSNILLENGMDLRSVTMRKHGEAMHLAPNGKEGHGYTAEEVYEMLVPPAGGKRKNAGGKGDGRSAERLDDHSHWPEETDRELEEEWDQYLREACEAIAVRDPSNEWGMMPAFAQRLLKELRRPQTDWRTVLNDFVQEEVTDYSFSPPDRRFDGSPFFLPDFNEKEDAVTDILFMIDTSGSMTDEMITAAYSEIKGAVDQFGGRLKGWVGFFDAVVFPPKPFEDEDSFLAIRPEGGGGTSFQIIFSYVKKHMAEICPVSIIVLTDGYALFPEEAAANGIPVLWLLNNEEVEPPWGKVARITV